MRAISISSENFSRLLLLLYESATTPERLPVFLQQLAGVLGAKAAVFREVILDGGEPTRIMRNSPAVTVGLDPEAIRRYVEYYNSVDLYVQRIIATPNHRTSDCGLSQAVVPFDEMYRTEMYNDYTKVFDVVPMMWGKLLDQPGYFAGVSFMRSERKPFFECRELQLLSSLIPHMRQSLRLSNVLRSHEAIHKHGFDKMGIAICLIRQEGTILHSTESAEQMFSSGNGIEKQNGRLRVFAEREQRMLDALIRGACGTGANSSLERAVQTESCVAGGDTVRSSTSQSGGVMLVTRRPPLRPIQVMVTPFCSGVLMNAAEATALIHFSDPAAAPPSRASALKALYRLTPVESRLADLLLRGLEVREAAEQLQTTIESARFHLKRILAKTDTRRQAELMRLMLSLPGTTTGEFVNGSENIPENGV